MTMTEEWIYGAREWRKQKATEGEKRMDGRKKERANEGIIMTGQIRRRQKGSKKSKRKGPKEKIKQKMNGCS